MPSTASASPSSQLGVLPEAPSSRLMMDATRKLLELAEPLVRGLPPEHRSFLEEDDGPSAAP